jgi:hypothetical protein
LLVCVLKRYTAPLTYGELAEMAANSASPALPSFGRAAALPRL